MYPNPESILKNSRIHHSNILHAGLCRFPDNPYHESWVRKGDW